MPVNSETVAAGGGGSASEPPDILAIDEARSAALVDRIMAVAHLQPAAHVAVIGRRTLPLLLEFLHRGCGCVRSLRPGAPSPDCEQADLAWIVDARTEVELDEALRAARSRTGACGRVIVEGAHYAGRDGVAAIPDHAVAAGLGVVSFDHVARRLVLSAA